MTPERNRSRKPEGNEEQHEDLLLLSKISNEMVQAQKRYFGRGPTQAKSYILDDFLLVVMRGGMTTAESTMLEVGREDMVRSFRQEIEDELAKRMTERMQELTGRTIINHQAQILFNPHIVVEMFFFESDRTDDPAPHGATTSEVQPPSGPLPD